MNGEVRDREKVARGLNKADTFVLPGYQIYHNYARPHEGLNNKTPAEKCGIVIEGRDKWKTLIENASKKLPNSEIYKLQRPYNNMISLFKKKKDDDGKMSSIEQAALKKVNEVKGTSPYPLPGLKRDEDR
jgi:hypothetical protein